MSLAPNRISMGERVAMGLLACGAVFLILSAASPLARQDLERHLSWRSSTLALAQARASWACPLPSTQWESMSPARMEEAFGLAPGQSFDLPSSWSLFCPGRQGPTSRVIRFERDRLGLWSARSLL